MCQNNIYMNAKIQELAICSPHTSTQPSTWCKTNCDSADQSNFFNCSMAWYWCSCALCRYSDWCMAKESHTQQAVSIIPFYHSQLLHFSVLAGNEEKGNRIGTTKDIVWIVLMHSSIFQCTHNMHTHGYAYDSVIGLVVILTWTTVYLDNLVKISNHCTCLLLLTSHFLKKHCNGYSPFSCEWFLCYGWSLYINHSYHNFMCFLCCMWR